MLYNAGNSRKEKIALIFKESAKKVGIKVKIEAYESSLYIDKIINHDFDLFTISKIMRIS